MEYQALTPTGTLMGYLWKVSVLVTVEANIGDTATFNCLADRTPGPDTYPYINGIPLEGKGACDCGG